MAQAQSPSSIEGDILVQLAYSAAKTFVTNYYTDLQAARTKLKDYYTPTAQVSWNGTNLTGGIADVEKLHTEMPPATYEVQCFDAQPLTPNGRGQCSILLVTNGYVKFGNEKDAPSRGFSETITLEPDTSTPPKFLISTQSTRFVF
ncbi:Nuclear transport factor 2 [Arthrobotrys flagrans]|uniref:NTF2-related export protein n=1 Tax=Arthrobotrys flagrans TaxID=97331 RepID=A0A436ZWT1_ARTFL|nr:Nuclear transport factor 2 [Arthrobotrys flagrans]